MGSTKTTVSLLMAFVPIAVCAGLVFYFMAVPGRMAAMVGMPEEATAGIRTQLGPTVIGVTAIGLLCAFAFIIRMVRAAYRGPAGPASGKVADAEDEAPFDADAALARYLARKAAGGEDVGEPASDLPPTEPRAFGRKTF